MLSRLSFQLGALLVGALAVTHVHAATLVTNGSFEQATPGSNPPDYGTSLTPSSNTLLGWSIVSPNGEDVAWLKSGAFGVQTPFENYFLDLTGYGGNGNRGGVQQTISTSLAQAYRLTFNLGFNNNTGGRQGPVSAQVTVGSLTTVFTTDGTGSLVTTPDGSTWESFALPFFATSASTSITFSGFSTAGDLIGLDNVAVVATGVSPVPLPAAAPLFGAALMTLGVAGYGLRRRKIAAASA